MLKPSAKVGVCPVCDQNVPLRPVPGRRWGIPTVVAEHHTRQGRRCPGQGEHTASRASAWGWPTWVEMSSRDQGSALVHVLRCSTPCTPSARRGHVGHRYQGVGLRDLDPAMACLHAWDQTGGWEHAVAQWGVEAVRQLVQGRVPIQPEQMLTHYGWGPECEAYVEEDRVIGVLATRASARPPGWVWRQASAGPAVAMPDGRSALGRSIKRHLMVVEAVPRVRVGLQESDAELGARVREAIGLWRPLDLESPDGVWVTVHPLIEKKRVWV